ncbi:hypothetical protein [Polymorphobacter megasporae]|uniref:hypothetical protein n=1 Tax=Glacieibacterium megasporae TaxID=2835787 RepID=UPI001C1E047F|nr:hypothetical protein [Polymorphobacter megasporae]UAJ09247.1 hypothetical protein KTC28_13025 [Polymorphobacter megasporae]
MAVTTVDTTVLNSIAAENYFLACDYRIRIGARAMMEILAMPVPDYLTRRKPGRTPALDVATAFAADHPKARTYTVAPRKPSAARPVATPPIGIPDTDADGPGLFASTFPAR